MQEFYIGLFYFCFVFPFYLATQHGGTLFKIKQRKRGIVVVHYAYPTRFVNAPRMLPPAGTPAK
jgi:hypothetical protein